MCDRDRLHCCPLLPHRPGHTPTTQGPLRISVWNVGSFDDTWADQNAAADLLDRGADVIISMTNGDTANTACHARGCLSIGWNTDKRETLGDSVAVSVTYHFDYIYLELGKRLVRGERFGPENFWSGFGYTVDLAALSPVVPVPVRREVERRAAVARLREGDEFIFCGNLTDVSGRVRLNGSSDTCFPSTGITTMNYYLAGLSHLGEG